MRLAPSSTWPFSVVRTIVLPGTNTVLALKLMLVDAGEVGPPLVSATLPHSRKSPVDFGVTVTVQRIDGAAERTIRFVG